MRRIDRTFDGLLLTWVEKLTFLNKSRVHDAIERVRNWRIDHLQRELLNRPSVDTAVALTLIAEAVDQLQRAGIPSTKLMAKLRRDFEVWPTWAELRAAALLLKTPPPGFASLQLEPNRKFGKHADFQFVMADGRTPLNIEFKTIGLSDEEVAFCGRMAPYLDVLLPPIGLFHLHARLSQQRIPFEPSQLPYYHSQAAEWATTSAYPAGLAGVVIVGHQGELNYARRLSLRLKEALAQVPTGQPAYAAFYWTNGAPTNMLCQHLNWDEIPENVEGIVLLGDSIIFPDSNIHSFRQFVQRGAEAGGAPSVSSSVSDELASLVFRRFERSSGVRTLLLSVTTEEGKVELLRRDSSRRILPFNLLMSADPEGALPRTGGHPEIWNE